MRRYCVAEACKEIEAAIHRLHVYVFDDEEWNIDDYIDLYAPIVVFLIYASFVWFIAQLIRVYFY